MYAHAHFRMCIHIKRTWLLKKCSQHGRLVPANGDGREGELHFSKEVSQEEWEEQPSPKRPPGEAPCAGKKLQSHAGKPNSVPQHIGYSLSSGHGWLLSDTCQVPVDGAATHPGLPSSCSFPLPCCSAGSAQLITIHKEPVWGFPICRGFRHGLQACINVPGHPKSLSPD